MRTRRRKSLALVASLVAHTVIVGGPLAKMSCVPDLKMPEVDLDIVELEIIDPDALQSEHAEEVPEEPPEPPPQPEEKPPEAAPPEPPTEEEGPKPPPKPDVAEEPEPKRFAEKRSRADRLAPPQSTFHMLLVPKKIRRLSFKQQVLDIMAPLPDFELLIDRGRFDALRDFDHIVIASPDIRDWTQTFLAVDFKIPRDEVKRGIERAVASQGEVIEWIEDDGLLRGNPRPADPEEEDADNRWFVFLDDKVAIYVRDEFLPSILEGPAEDGRKTSGNFVANLSRLRRFSARQPRAGMQLLLKGIRRSLKGTPKIAGKPLPFVLPDDFELSASADEEPEVLLRLTFADIVEAKTFVQWWDVDLRALINGSITIKFQAGGIYDAFEIEQDGTEVRLSGVMTTGQAMKIMEFAADGSRRVAKKTPEEIEEMRQRRIDAMKARRGGKLPPSVLDPEPEPDSPQDTPPAPSGSDLRSTPTQPPSPAAEAPEAPATPPAGPSGSAPKPTKPNADDGNTEPVPG